MTQEAVAEKIGVARSTIAQIELGNREVSSLELDRLAYVYGRDLREFLHDPFREVDVLVALFRADPEGARQEKVLDAVRECLALGRELVNLDQLLGITREVMSPATYRLPPPSGRWEAIEQGSRIATEERRRLGLGSSPLGEMAELLDRQGVRVGLVDLPDDVSGLTVVEPDLGAFVVAHKGQHWLRRRYSLAHEYAHVLLDRDRQGTISRAADRDSLIEVRANSFAAAFLMPETGVREFVAQLGKGRASRTQAQVFDGAGVVPAEGRSEPGSQDLKLYDVVLLAHHFAASRVFALYRLRNLRLITDAEFEELHARDEQGAGGKIARLLDLHEPDHAEARNEFRHRVMARGLEAYRRGLISQGKVIHLGKTVGLRRDDVLELLDRAGIEESDEGATPPRAEGRP